MLLIQIYKTPTSSYRSGWPIEFVCASSSRQSSKAVDSVEVIQADMSSKERPILFRISQSSEAMIFCVGKSLLSQNLPTIRPEFLEYPSSPKRRDVGIVKLIWRLLFFIAIIRRILYRFGYCNSAQPNLEICPNCFLIIFEGN